LVETEKRTSVTVSIISTLPAMSIPEKIYEGNSDASKIVFILFALKGVSTLTVTPTDFTAES
jgi:hypothetical protein